jgi:hypothetical protein
MIIYVCIYIFIFIFISVVFPISYPTHSNQASITVEGTEFVIDSARAKEVSYDPYLKVLGMTWKSHWDIWYYIWIYGTIYGYMVPYVAGIYAEQFMEVGHLRDPDDESLDLRCGIFPDER